jgi:hypothetical protein
VHGVLGNNDGDPRLLLLNAQAVGNVTLHGQYAELTLAGRRVAVNHYPEIARRVAESGQFDLVCYGHNHLAKVEQVGVTVLANPGEIMGRFGAPSFGLYDTVTGQFELHPVAQVTRLSVIYLDMALCVGLRCAFPATPRRRSPAPRPPTAADRRRAAAAPPEAASAIPGWDRAARCA